jgi:hypothetical protein
MFISFECIMYFLTLVVVHGDKDLSDIVGVYFTITKFCRASFAAKPGYYSIQLPKRKQKFCWSRCYLDTRDILSVRKGLVSRVISVIVDPFLSNKSLLELRWRRQ